MKGGGKERRSGFAIDGEALWVSPFGLQQYGRVFAGGAPMPMSTVLYFAILASRPLGSISLTTLCSGQWHSSSVPPHRKGVGERWVKRRVFLSRMTARP